MRLSPEPQNASPDGGTLDRFHQGAHGMVRLLGVWFPLLGGSSPPPAPTPQTAHDGSPDGAVTPSAAANVGEPDAGAAPPAKKEAPPFELTGYIKAHLPKGGTVEAGSPPKITHVVQ